MPTKHGFTEKCYGCKYLSLCGHGYACTNENYCNNADNMDELSLELKESEDERIRNWLIAQLELKSDVNNPHDLELMILKSMAWLEKQGIEKLTVKPKFKVGDYIERKDGLGCHAKIIFIGKNVYGCEKLIYPKDTSPFFELTLENQDEFRISPDFQQKHAWREEDDDAWMNDIISKVENNLQLNKAEIDWLKSLKQRIGGEL